MYIESHAVLAAKSNHSGLLAPSAGEMAGEMDTLHASIRSILQAQSCWQADMQKSMLAAS